MKLRTALPTLCLLAVLPSAALAERGLEGKDLATMDRVSSPVLSPDGARVVFALRTVDFEADSASTALYMRDLRTRDMRPPHQVTPAGWSVSSPAFSPDGSTLYFLSAKSGSQQLYAMPLAGGEPRQLTDFAVGIGTWQLSPQGDRIAFTTDVFPDCGADFGCTQSRLDERKESKTTGVLYDQLFVRHWDTWKDGRQSKLFSADLPAAGGEPVTQATGLGLALAGDIPAKPFGGASDYAWAPDGRSLAVSVKTVEGSEQAWSTDFDLYRLSADGTGSPVNLTPDSAARDAGPVFSPDGSTLYYRAMSRPGFEADRYALMALDLASGERREIAPDWDRSPGSIEVADDGASLYVTAQHIGQYPLFKVDVQSGEVTELVSDGTVTAFTIEGDTLAFTRNSMATGDVLYVAQPDGSNLRQITRTAEQMLDGVAMGEYEQFSFRGADDATVYGWVVKPAGYQEGQQYPVAFLIHGGPQGSFGNSWSYRWNPQTYAGAGYAVVMVDFHGSTGYGQAFTDAISGDWGDKPLVDLQKGWEYALAEYDFLDGDRACALGASYGGYMVNWIASQWKEPWKCLVNHNGVFDTRSMGLVTEELWFTEWEHGGTVYDNPDAYERYNPARHIGEWEVPMLVVAGANDFRVPVDQSLSTFTALQRQGIESQLLYFPDENHWVLKPNNSVLWHQTVKDWLDRHTGN